MARFLPLAALLLVATAIVLAAAGTLDDPAAESPREPGAAEPAEPAAPERVARVGATLALPLGLYPALSAQHGLAPPSEEALEDARRFARSREGEVSFAVVGANREVTGLGATRVYDSASLIKAMILVAYLRELAAGERDPTDLELQRMDDMIRVSDNFSASELYEELGPEPMEELASEAGMSSFEADAFWGNCAVTAADQVRFFEALDRLLPAAHRDFARQLLESVASFHSWGIPEAARPKWRVFFKGGWRPDDEDGQIVHQAALLERGTGKLALAVLSEQNPSETYGHDTIRGIARRLLVPGVTPGVLVPLTALADRS